MSSSQSKVSPSLSAAAGDPSSVDDGKLEMPFEECLERLKSLVDDMESGRLGLDEMIDRYGQGVKLVRMCEKRLQDAEGRIHELMEKNGELSIKPMEE